VKELTCVYHTWSYDLKGQLQTIAFRKSLNGGGKMLDNLSVA
jgi:phenylpropionate dioxygenase-like ring-hydroxylating dioxygenase large terminal subunit